MPVVVAAALVVLDLVAPLGTAGEGRGPADFVTFHLAMIAFVVAGTLSLRMVGQVGNGRLMLALAGAGSVFDLLGWTTSVGPSAFLTGPVYGVYAALFAHLLLRWPEAAVHGARRVLVGIAYVGLPLTALIWQLTWDPRWSGPSSTGWWWPVLVPSRSFSDSAWMINQSLLAAVVVAGLVLVVLRLVRTENRRGLLPVAIAALALGATVLLEVAGAFIPGLIVDTAVVQNMAALALPIAVVAGDVRRRDEAHLASFRSRPHAFRIRPQTRYRALVAGSVLLVAAMLILMVGLDTEGDGNGNLPQPAPAPVPAPPPID